MNCTYCGAEIKGNVNYCPTCGAPVTMAQKSAANNEAGMNAYAQQPYTEVVYQLPDGRTYTPSMQKSKLAAGLIAIFLGALGIHNFYLGNNSKGLTQLLVALIGGVFSCGLATIAVQIWALVEGVQIFTGSIATDAFGIPLKE